MRLEAGLLVGAALALLAPPADACSPPQPGLFGTVPADGVTWPGNASILFEGYDIILDDVSVSVDGVPAELVVDTSPTAQLASLAAHVSPMPEAGQTVVVSGSFCADPGSCAPTTISLIAGPPDLVAPSTEGQFEVSYDVHDHLQFLGGVGSCQGDVGLTYYIRVDSGMTEATTGGAPGDGAVVYWHVTGIQPSNAAPLFDRVIAADGSDLDLQIALPENVASPADICVEVALGDAAGNVLAQVASTCAACMFRDDDDGGDTEAFVAEPAWNASDAYPGGSCTTGLPPEPQEEPRGDVVVSGCGCHVAGERARAPWWLALAAGAIALLRRRR
jgi:MYXO-CTERM domain-containing protein